MKRVLAVRLAASAITGCGDTEDGDPGDPAAGSWPVEVTPEPGFDPDDPALSTIPYDDASRQKLLRRAGERRDFRVPRVMLDGLQDDPLVLAVVARPFDELAGDEPAVRRLNAGQRAVYAMYLADFEILNGGFAGDVLATLDERYAATQYRRETALALVLAPYIRAHFDEFAIG